MITDKEVITLIEGWDEKPPSRALSVKFRGMEAQIFRYLKSKGYRNSSRALKNALKALAYLVAREALERPVLIGPNDSGIDEKTPLLQALGIYPDTEVVKGRRGRKKKASGE